MPDKNSSAAEVFFHHHNSEPQQTEVRLYCVEHCRVCNEARSIILKAGVVAHDINILDNDNLFVTYRLRIPVMQRVDNNEELDGPFEAIDVSKFVMSPA